MKKLSILFFLSAICIGFRASSQTSLSSGDLFFVGFQSGETGNLTAKDRFAFILLKDVAFGTKLAFTDNAVLSPSPIQLCTNEGYITWTAEENLSAGAVVILSQDTTSNTGIVSGGLSFSQSGDQILAFQINALDTLPLAAFSSTGWLTSCSAGCGNTSGNNSATCLPAGLQSQVNAMDFPVELNNSYFNLAQISGTPEEIKAQIMNPANWTRSESIQTWPNWSATVTAISGAKSIFPSIMVYPNPANGSFFLKAEQAGSFNLFDARGVQVYSRDLSPGENQIEVFHLDKGLFFGRFQNRPGSIRLDIR